MEMRLLWVLSPEGSCSRDGRGVQPQDWGGGRGWPPPPGNTYLPGVGQAADGRVAEAKHDGKEGVEVLLFLEAVSRKTRDPQGKQPYPQSPTSRQHPDLAAS